MKTLALDFLVNNKAEFKQYTYECAPDHHDFGHHAAKSLGLSEEKVFKTIILHHDKKHLERVKNQIAEFLDQELHLQLNKKTCIRPTSMGAEYVGFRIWSTHVKLRKKTARKMVKRLRYVFAAYHAGEIDRESMERTVASYRGILQHFNSYGMKQKLNEIYKQEVQGQCSNS